MQFKVNKKMILEESRILRGIGGTALGAGLGAVGGMYAGHELGHTVGLDDNLQYIQGGQNANNAFNARLEIGSHTLAPNLEEKLEDAKIQAYHNLEDIGNAQQVPLQASVAGGVVGAGLGSIAGGALLASIAPKPQPQQPQPQQK